MITRPHQRKRETPRVQPPRYALAPDGCYAIDRYDTAPGFCSFLPGVAGPAGVPLWCLYVNRAQGIASFGVRDKDHAIVEYLPATWAYQLVGVQGFRTFCKLDGQYYEPFRDGFTDPDTTRVMHIQPDVLELTETNPHRGLQFDVRYFSPVNRNLGALVRRVKITNLGRQARQLTLLDGLPLIIPAGFSDHGLKAMRHIYEAYASVKLVHGQVPFFAAKVAAHDEAEVVHVSAGNFYAAWLARGSEWLPLQPLIDPHLIFGGGHDLVTPRHFIAQDTLDRAAQVWENRMPCALAPVHTVLDPGETIQLFAVIGHAPHEQMLDEFLTGFARPADFDRALAESHALLDDVLAPATQASALPVLDAYVRQNYLDNILRGGVPAEFPSQDGPTLLNLYSRRHGDLERDYNFFIVPAQPLSSGAGNYRDICQNRRWDVWFYPHVGAHEINEFVALLQADGYNPLGLEGYRWRLAAGRDAATLCPATDPAARGAFARLLTKGCQPGDLVQWARQHGLPCAQDAAWLNGLLAQCTRTLVAGGHEGGYWVDHWTYVTDLLDAFATTYPDRVAAMLTAPRAVDWFDEGAYVVPRRTKYQRRTTGLLQVGAVADGAPAATPLPATTVLGKLCAIVAVKAVSFDAAGQAIEMEAGRPGWNDSLNGLPGLFGSSTCEAAELARLAAWLRAHVAQLPDTELPAEVADFLQLVVADLEMEYSWERATALREDYRARLRAGASGRTRVVSGAQLAALLDGAERRARHAIEKSIDARTGLLHTYYANRPQEAGRAPTGATATTASQTDAPVAPVQITGFTPAPLPLYLEGQVHWLRLPSGRAQARTIYRAVRNSPLFDAALQMYKLNECLDACGPDIGRARTFTRGWFENESIWLHMSYKYLLELLRCGLYEEFFTDADTMLVPFMNPEVYGRSILENCSFLGSSANPDPATHGRGFIARLSGSTAEFIHIWLLLTVGERPFYVDGHTDVASSGASGALRLRLQPALPAAWFTTAPQRVRHGARDVELPADTFACTLLGSTLLVYHNPQRRDTYGPAGVRPARYVLDEREEFTGDALPAAAAERIRHRQCRRIDVWLE